MRGGVFQINNPDMRVQILKDFVKQHFPATHLLDYALDVEKITTSKVQCLYRPLLPTPSRTDDKNALVLRLRNEAVENSRSTLVSWT